METEEIDPVITADDMMTIMPVILIIMPFVILISLLFPKWFKDDDKYFKSWKEYNPGWFSKEI